MSEKEFDVQNGRIDWSEISAHANKKACKPWIAVVDDYDENDYKYNWNQDFLNKSTIDGKEMMKVSELARGDVIRVSGASHNNDKTRCWRIVSVSEDTLTAEKISESEAIETVQDNEKTAQQQLIELAQEMDEDEAEMALEKISEYAVAHRV